MTTQADGFEGSAQIVNAFMASIMDNDETLELLEMMTQAIRDRVVNN